MNIAIVTAHPDDAEYMMAGTVIKYIEKGHKVSIIICTNGDKGSSSAPKPEIAKIRKNEAQKSAKYLGANVFFLYYHDEFMPDNIESRLKIMDTLRKVNPDVVFTHHFNDISNADHRVISNIVLDTSYLTVAKNIVTKHKETKKSPAFYYIDIPGGANFEPNEFVDVSEVIEKKKKAFSFHDSQISWMKKIGAGDVMKNMFIQSSFRGMQCGCDHAEAFISLNKYPRGRVKSYLPQYL